MIVELHMLQNFAPSNLNRDDTNSPKDCEFGGFRRARISSQCLKRAMRSEFSRSHLLDEANLSKRTKNLVDQLVKRLVTGARPETEVRPVVEFAVNSTGLSTEDGKTQYLLFLASAGIARFAELIGTHWDELQSAAPVLTADAKPVKGAKKKAKADAPAAIKEAVKTLLDGTRAADLALFGRMLADLPEQNVDAACQVAHAISTNKIEMEFDFYTAVDDFQTDAETGAGMMGTVEFNSACFYRYANVDVAQLTKNLGGDAELAGKTIEAFLRAAILAIPTGKQNSMAAQNPPSFVLAVVRDSGHWSLANAFVEPVWLKRDEDLVTKSIRRLDGYWKQLEDAYGKKGIAGKSVLVLNDVTLLELPDSALKNSAVKTAGDEGKVDVLVADVLKHVGSSNGKAGQ